MSQSEMSAWGKWQQTRNTLATSLALNIAARNQTPGNGQLQENVEQLLKDLKVHALNGLSTVDLTIADQNLVRDITTASAAAKKEADRLKKITANINDFTKLVGDLTNLVGKFTLL
jgi:hypothetical protein